MTLNGTHDRSSEFLNDTVVNLWLKTSYRSDILHRIDTYSSKFSSGYGFLGCINGIIRWPKIDDEAFYFFPSFISNTLKDLKFQSEKTNQKLRRLQGQVQNQSV